MLNYCVMTGRMTADPELRTTENGTPVLSFSLAVQRNYKPKDSDDYPVDFLNFVAWRGTAEFISKYFRKGSMISVEGNLESRKYTDKEGNNRTAFEVKVERAHFGDSISKQNSESTTVAQANSVGGFEPDFGTVDYGGDDDLPFEGGFPPFNG